MHTEYFVLLEFAGFAEQTRLHNDIRLSEYIRLIENLRKV